MGKRHTLRANSDRKIEIYGLVASARAHVHFSGIHRRVMMAGNKRKID
jgi:hypothetical protein